MKKRTFTWLDGVLCAVLALVLIVGGVFLFGKGDKAAVSSEKTYEMTMRFNRATTEEFDCYKVGDTLYFQNRTGVLGTVTDLKLIDKVQEEYDEENGRFVAVVDPEIRAVEMKVQVQGGVKDGAFTVGGQELHIGQVLYPQSDTTRSIMTIWDIEEVQA